MSYMQGQYCTACCCGSFARSHDLLIRGAASILDMLCVWRDASTIVALVHVSWLSTLRSVLRIYTVEAYLSDRPKVTGSRVSPWSVVTILGLPTLWL